MAIVAAVIIVGVSIFVLGHAEGDVVEYEVDDTQAFYLAEAGLEHARGYLGVFEQEYPNGDPVGTTFENTDIGGGRYFAEVLPDSGASTWPEAYEVVSTGWKDGTVRQVKATVAAQTFAIYQWFIESGGGGYSWFRTGERFEGPVHVNGSAKIAGDPWFGGLLTAVGNVDIVSGNPTFVEGYLEGVDSIDLPTRDYVLATLRNEATQPGGIYLPALGNKTYYEVILGDPVLGQLSYQGRDEYGTAIPGSDGIVTLSATSGAMWSEEDVWIKGTLDGQLTLGADANIHIRDDIIYADSSPGSGPNPGCDDMLGLVAAGHPDGDIFIDYTVPNQTDVEVHAVMMSLQKTIEAEDYQLYGPRGDFVLWGGMLADYAIHLAQLDTDGNLISGYYRDYHYDYRVGLLPPPFFPYEGSYSVKTWQEVKPPVLS
jgi:hypothetical protein